MAIIVDIETVAIDGAAALIEPVSAPSTYKDPEKIAAYIAEKTAEAAAKAALYPWTARVVALGVSADAVGDVVYLAGDETDEAEALRRFWRLCHHVDDRYVEAIIGFNHLAFDLPVLLARSLLLGVPTPAISLDKYRSPHIDVMARLTWHGAIPARSLKWFARRFGLPVEDSVGGADVARLVAAGDWEAVHAHCLSDVRLTRALAERLKVVRPAATAEAVA